MVPSLWERVQLGVQAGRQRPEGRPPFWDEDRPGVFFSAPLTPRGGAYRSPSVYLSGVVVGWPIPALFEMGRGGNYRDQERPEWQLLIPRVGHKGTSFRSHSGGRGGPEVPACEWGHGEMVECQHPDGESPRPAPPHAWMSKLCLSGRLRVTLSSRQTCGWDLGRGYSV